VELGLALAAAFPSTSPGGLTASGLANLLRSFGFLLADVAEAIDAALAPPCAEFVAALFGAFHAPDITPETMSQRLAAACHVANYWVSAAYAALTKPPNSYFSKQITSEALTATY